MRQQHFFPEFYKQFDCGSMGSSIGCYAWLARLAESISGGPHGRILEIGTGLGASATALALGAPGATVDTIDYLPNPASPGDVVVTEKREAHWSVAGVRDRIRFHHGTTHEVLDSGDPAGPWDLVFIDGSHDWTLKMGDWNRIKGRSDFVVFDDYFPWGPWAEEARNTGWTETPGLPEDLLECFPGGTAEAWMEGRVVNTGGPKFGIFRAPEPRT